MVWTLGRPARDNRQRRCGREYTDINIKNVIESDKNRGMSVKLQDIAA
jgi:hypothetical protein